jgi:adenylate cyclase
MNQEGRVVELLEQLNEYFEVVVNVLHSKGGTVDKYMGDAVLAVFGAPLSRGLREEVQAALEAVVELGEGMERLNERWQAEGKDPWRQVLVLSAGVVISGNVGSTSRMDYTIMGDAVNLASRLEGVAKQANRNIVVSQSVAENAGPGWHLLSVGEYEIRGQGTQEVFTMEGAVSLEEKSV